MIGDLGVMIGGLETRCGAKDSVAVLDWMCDLMIVLIDETGAMVMGVLVGLIAVSSGEKEKASGIVAS